VLRVGRVLELGQRLRVVREAEVGDAAELAAEVRDQRVVGVQHEPRAAGVGGDDLRPAVRQQVQLPVAVELVAEQVREQEHARLDRLRDGPEPRLVDLEQAELAAAAAGVEQRGRDAPGHVRPGAVVDHRAAGAVEDRGDHCGGRRLPVGRGDQHGAVVEHARHRAERAGGEPQQEPSGRGRAARATEAAADGAHEAREAACDRAHRGGPASGAITRRQPRSTVRSTGVRAIGSPSA
jgi:hypothetical protein